MDREAEEFLLDFCHRQRLDFNVDAWFAFPCSNNDELAAAALFLSCVDWYGHEDELRLVADTLRPGCVGHFSRLAKAVRFDCSRFSSMLKTRISREASIS